MDSTASPRVVGRYFLYDTIAADDMATVHLGRLAESVKSSRVVAIQRMHEHLARDPEFAATFVDEAKVIARIRHPNVVPTIDVVAVDHELLLVTEYVAGETLSRLLERARAMNDLPPIPLVIDIVLGVLRGLAAVHEFRKETGEPLHIVHRNVSPRSILVGTDGVARVVDIGIAQSRRDALQTREGYLKGNLPYAAPEQLRGRAATPASDIFATSVVLFEALTGRDPFERAGNADPVDALERQPTPPSAFRSEIPQVLDDIILQGLNKEPSERFLTARAMAAALESAVAPAEKSIVRQWVAAGARQAIEHRAALLARAERDISPASGRLKSDAPVAIDTGTTGETRAMSDFDAAVRPRTARRVVGVAAKTLALAAGVVLGFQVPVPSRSDNETTPSVPALASPAGRPQAESPPETPPPPTLPPAAPAETIAPAPTTAPNAPTAPEPMTAPEPTAPKATTAKPRPVKENQAERIYKRD